VPAAPFTLFWHRLGNDRRGVAAVVAARAAGPATLAGRPLRHGLELDLKWTDDGGRPLLYGYHGPTGRQVLGPAAARRRALPLEALFALPGAIELSYLIELKRGHGPAEAALERLAALLAAAGVAERTWLAASSLALLDAAAAILPDRPRVLFGSPFGAGDRVLHKPTTRIRASLAAAGLAPRLTAGRVQLLCPIGLRERALARHRALARAARARGLDYLPGRVVRAPLLAGLAAEGLPGAFVYSEPERLRLEVTRST